MIVCGSIYKAILLYTVHVFILGFGIFATESIPHESFIVEYAGELISDEIGDGIEDQTYIYHFEVQGHSYW